MIFDSTVPEGEAAPVYCEARAEEVPASDRARAIAACTRRAEAIGDSTFGEADVIAPSALRLYRASASAHYLLGEGDHRVRVALA